MKKVLVFCLVVVFMLAFGVVRAAEQVQRSEVVTARATVDAVDQENRIVTLRGPEGNTFTVKVGEDVRNLSQLKPSDQVVVRYHQSLLVEMATPGQQPASSVSRSVERAMPGQKPEGVATEQVTTTATVVAVDRRNSEVTLKVPQGNVVTVKAIDPKNLERLKAGDELYIAYLQAVAISIEKAAG